MTDIINKWITYLKDLILPDVNIYIIIKYDITFYLLFIRVFLITFIVAFFDPHFSVGLALGVNFTWEWQDGLHNDGFNILDLLAGLFGTVLGHIVQGFVWN